RRTKRSRAALADRKAETQGVAFPLLKVHTWANASIPGKSAGARIHPSSEGTDGNAGAYKHRQMREKHKGLKIRRPRRSRREPGGHFRHGFDGPSRRFRLYTAVHLPNRSVR